MSDASNKAIFSPNQEINCFFCLTLLSNLLVTQTLQFLSRHFQGGGKISLLKYVGSDYVRRFNASLPAPVARNCRGISYERDRAKNNGGSVIITILGWDKINGRKDVINPSWFKFKHSFFEDSEFYEFSHEEICCWIYLLCQASKISSNRVKVNFLHAERIGRLSRQAIERTVSKLRKIDCIGTEDDMAMAVIEESRLRASAVRKVKNAIKRGVLVRPSACSSCNDSTRKIQAHHHDYNQPLTVSWLCTTCHGKEHKGKHRLTEFIKNKNTRTSAKNTSACSREDKIREEEIRLDKRREEDSGERFSQTPSAAIPDYSSLSETFLERKVDLKVQRSWAEAFPDREWVVAEIRKALAWELSNPTRRKKNFSAFITRWLTKGWDYRKTESTPVRRGIEEILADEEAKRGNA